MIVEKASGFLYYVSREGVTGEREDLAGDLKERVGSIREHTNLPVVVGFGISTPGQVSEVSSCADGVVVGSALVNCISENLGSPEKITEIIGNKVEALTAGLARTQ